MGQQGNLDGFQGLAGTGMVFLVILHSDVFRIFPLQPLKQLIQDGFLIWVILIHITAANHFQYHGEVLLVLGRFVV